MSVDDRPSTPEQAEEPTAPDAASGELAAEANEVAGIVGSPWSRALRLGVLGALLVLLGVTRGLPILIVILAIVVMVVLHEVGHYVAAKRAGMKVTEFFVGFGPVIWSTRRGETEFGLKAIPAGAYVRIIGMNNLEEVDPADEPRTYRQASFRSRASVAVAGSAMHFAIALVLLVVQFALIGRADPERWTVAEVTPGSAAAAAGIQPGDTVRSIDGRPVGSFLDFRSIVAEADPGTYDVVVDRDGGSLTVPVELSRRVKVIGTVGEDLDLLQTADGVAVGATRPGGAVAGSGVAEGDVVTAINGRPVTGLEDVAAAAAAGLGGVVVLDTPTGERRIDLGSAVEVTPPSSFFGVGQAAVVETEAPHVAVGSAVSEFGRTIGLSVAGVGQFLWPPNLLEFVTTPARSADRAEAPTTAEQTAPDSRPISIVGAVLYGSELTSENLSNLVGFLIVLNIFIGVFNLLPLLPFDGGHLVIACYEKAQELRRRQQQRYIADVSRLLPVTYGVVMVLVVVGLVAVYLDLTRGVSA